MSDDMRARLTALLHVWLDGTEHCPYRPAVLCPGTRRSEQLADSVLALIATPDEPARKTAWDSLQRRNLAILVNGESPDPGLVYPGKPNRALSPTEYLARLQSEAGADGWHQGLRAWVSDTSGVARALRHYENPEEES